MQNDKTAEQRGLYSRADAPLSTGNPFWDVMLSLGKASSQALAGYAGGVESGARTVRGGAVRAEAAVEVIPVGEETLNVGTRTVQGETTRVRRVVVETPVEEQVTLREERVIVERRKPTPATATATQGVLDETVAEMTDTYEVAEVWKSVRVVEEVVLRREVIERTETVRDTVRRDEVTVEHAPRLPRPKAARPALAERARAEVARAEPVAPPAPRPEAPAATQDVAPHVIRPDADAAPAQDKAAQDKGLIVPTGALDRAKAAPAPASTPAPRAEADKGGQDKAGPARKN